MRAWSVKGIVGAALLGFVVGWLAGYIVVRPTDDDMREAVETLVPPGATITDRSSGGSDWSPLRNDFAARLDFLLAPEASAGELVEGTRAAMRPAGWRKVREEQVPAGTRLLAGTSVLEARTSLRHGVDPPSGAATVGRRLDAIRGTARTTGLAGAVATPALLLWRSRARDGSGLGGRAASTS